MTNESWTGDAARTTTYFTGKTSAYDRYRPGYPGEAIRAILDGLPASRIVADVGCGTGISSRLLARAGARVIGVEPNDEMRAKAVELGSPGEPIDYRPGTGEATGLDDGSVHAVVCAQSFHWFDAAAALREFHRITKPGGRVALMWNTRDDSDEASQAYEAISRDAQAAAERAGRSTRRNRSADPTESGWFTNARTLTFPNPVTYSLEELLGRAHSASYFPESGELRESLDQRLRALFQQFSAEDRVTIGQVTRLTIAERTPDGAKERRRG